MVMDQDYVLDALLQHDFLPNSKEDPEELPPNFSSGSFSKSAAEQLVNSTYRRPKGYPGYDTVEYRLTRFNGVSRTLSIPHPRAHAQLALLIAKNWGNLQYITTNSTSQSRPGRHPDGRISIMNYSNRIQGTRRTFQTSFGRRFLVRTDISNFFPSIYSHSIPWALVGFAKAKKNRGKTWFNNVDRALQATKRNETKGIAIGPATSHILSEAILARVDEKLSTEFTYSRFMDDYNAYCASHDEARRFVLRLSEELAEYKLELNINKTDILPLPQPSASNWLVELNSALPSKGRVSEYDAVRFLDLAIHLAGQSPDGSVLKYALKTLIGSLGKDKLTVFLSQSHAIGTILSYALNLSFHQLVLVPLLDRLLDVALLSRRRFPYRVEIQRLLCEYTRARYSDATSWILYYSKIYGVPVQECCAERIVASRDCVPLLLLYLSDDPNHQTKVIDFANALDRADLYELDNYWLLLYQLFVDKRIKKPYTNSDDTFDIMKKEGVSFVS